MARDLLVLDDELIRAVLGTKHQPVVGLPDTLDFGRAEIAESFGMIHVKAATDLGQLLEYYQDRLLRHVIVPRLDLEKRSITHCLLSSLDELHHLLRTLRA